MKPSRLQFALLSLASVAWIPPTLVRFTHAPANYLCAAAALSGPLLFLIPNWRDFGFAQPTPSSRSLNPRPTATHSPGSRSPITN